MTTERGARLVDAFARELPAGADHRDLRAAAARVLRARLPHAYGVWATLDPLTAMWTSCVLDGFERDMALERAIFRNEYRVEDRLKLRDLARGAGAGALAVDTGGDPAGSARYREIFEPMGVVDELRVVCSVDGTPWGALVLLSTERRFDRDDVEAARAVSRPFGLLLRQALLAGTVGDPWRPGTVVCAEDGRVIDLSPLAADLLGAADPDEVPAALPAAVTRFVGGGGADSVAATGSAWIGLRCLALDGRVLVVVDRIDPHRLADVLIEGAGLTARERDVLQAVLRGDTARAASRRLRLSEHTVNDHLKRIFAKFGVGSRGGLVAHLFTAHYEGLHAVDAPPSSRTHFLSSAQRG